MNATPKLTIEKLRLFLFTNQTAGQTIAKNAVWLSVGKIGGRLLRTLLVIYAARILGPAEWGVFSYAVNLVAILAVLTDFGVSAILTRENAKSNKPEMNAEVISSAFFLKILLVVPGLAFLVFFAPRFAILQSILPLLAFFGLMLALDSIRQFGFSLIKAMERMEAQAGLYIITNAIIVISGFAFLYIAPSISSLTYAYVLGTAAGTIATLFFLRKFWGYLSAGINWTLAKTILASAWPFALSSLIGSIMISTDVFIIGFFRSAEEVGYYSVADKIMQILYAPSLVLATSTLPSFSRLVGQGSGVAGKMFRYILKRIILFLSFATIIGIIFTPLAVKLLFSATYEAAILPLQILLLTLVFRYLSVLLGNLAFAHNQQKIFIPYAALGIFLNVSLDLILIPRVGIVGSAIATVISQVVICFYLWGKTVRLRASSAHST